MYKIKGFGRVHDRVHRYSYERIRHILHSLLYDLLENWYELYFNNTFIISCDEIIPCRKSHFQSISRLSIGFCLSSKSCFQYRQNVYSLERSFMLNDSLATESNVKTLKAVRLLQLLVHTLFCKYNHVCCLMFLKTSAYFP